MQSSTFLHLRFPFSFFLLPVYLFAVSTSQNPNLVGAIVTGLILHLLLYPASNGYNSYFDKDEDSIGGLRIPPKVTVELYYTSILLDLVALGLGAYFIGATFTAMILIYGLASKAYSHPAIRIKKYPIFGWLAIFIFQGYFTFLTCYIGINDFQLTETFCIEIQLPAILSSMLLGGSYPMTQIYQHKEDGRRGDYTLSRMMGVTGTFHFTAIMFFLAVLGFVYYFLAYGALGDLLFFQLMITPSLLYFVSWYLKVRKDPTAADYSSTMNLSWISSTMLNAFFLIQLIH